MDDFEVCASGKHTETGRGRKREKERQKDRESQLPARDKQYTMAIA